MTSDGQDTRYEIRDTKEVKLTPAMRRWVALLERGYTIRLERAWREREGGLTWRPSLYNPEGAFVQRVRLDTARRLERLGYLKVEGSEEAGGG